MASGTHDDRSASAVRTLKPSRPQTAGPAGSTSAQAGHVLGLQRSAGNQAVTSLVRSGGWSTTAVQRRTITVQTKPKDTDFNNQQYRVSGDPPDRLIQLVERRLRPDGTTPYYVALGTVDSFTRNQPVITRYAQAMDLGDWAPRVTHINGMGVTPKSGMTSAKALLTAVEAQIRKAGGEVAVEKEAIDVLFTYSAKRGNVASDIYNCIKGKLGVEDSVTRSQEQTMLDAVAAKRRIHVSAHSRGTIKTDNAVRTVFTTLAAQYKPAMKQSRQVQSDARRLARNYEATGIMSMQVALPLAIEQAAAYHAEQRAKAEMDAFIQLVYGGNAVSYPSKVIPVELFVGSADFVSLGVGTYTKSGAKWASGNDRTKLHKQGGGHGYTENYAGPVGAAIGADIRRERRVRWQDQEET